ncbi:uncharacterized protein isoform X2 [Musca autumnalis]|uniref:uncharacterized protein isoform X2 n=1 Tax=Musca autumnalis TaxID=221902 RepID=UPI003CF25B1A
MHSLSIAVPTTVGHSMQDIARDDFSLLNVGEGLNSTNNHTEKDMCPTLISRIQSSSPLLPKHLTVDVDNVAPTSAFASVKLEDNNALDLFPSHPSTWQQHPMNSHELAHHRLSVHHHISHDHNQRFDPSNNSKLLLQGSEDPLISHGANSVISQDDEHPADFAKCLLTSEELPQASSSSIIPQERPIFTTTVRTNINGPPPPTSSSQPTIEPPPTRPIKSGCSNLTKQQLKVKANLMSARNQQQQQQQQLQQQRENNATTPTIMSTQCTNPKQRSSGSVRAKKKPNNSIKLRFHHQALPPEYLSHYEATQGQQARSTKPAKSTTNQQRSTSKSTHRNSHENVRSWLQKIAEIQRTANASKADQSNKPQQSPLDSNNNPHNQNRTQTITSSTTANTTTTTVIHSTSEASNTTKIVTKPVNHRKAHFYSDLPYMGEITLDNSKPRRGRKPKKADICHLIYKNYGTIMPKRQVPCEDSQADLKQRLEDPRTKTDDSEEQPLNLCLRDQHADAYSISSADDASETNSSCHTPPLTTPTDIDRDSMLANNLKRSLTNLNELDNESIKLEAKDIPPSTSSLHLKSSTYNEESPLNPLSLYYQKLLESGVLLQNANGPIRTIQKDNQLALKIPIPSGLFLTPKVEKSTGTAASSPAPSIANSLSLEYPEQLSTPSSIKSENSTATNASSSTIMGNNNSTNTSQQQAPQKRKRSAIFIPPMNTENTTNPATEVSICKFKFTGGSKPTLQEKKMLSVDAGGNYRYFSGTGDKTTRGYEYFPREVMQTGGLLHGTGQKLLIDIPPPSAGLSNELLQLTESPTANILLSQSTAATNGSVITHTTISSKTPPPPHPVLSAGPIAVEEMRPNEPCISNYFEDNFENNPTPSTSPSSTNRFMLSRKKQALHQLRRSTQREKLEKTFKEQGFLIQTQQLESAEGATYCKFRQLKKFTRYLFRNWKDYLPDEIQRNENGTAEAASTVAVVTSTNEEINESLGKNMTLSLTGDFHPMESVIEDHRGEEHLIE